ncbi:hypothetical protein [Desulfoluna spongiiphila]|uniref:Uncharacterized protein n=1 Tax=Desulfoluna spongiiphila TaxID=419481 RepID=A0A1G5IR96_9BACT|nr:hypothetical protein [Desulfoluna spongiiphila]SCY78635.1 hypothetical protein SAMN05216233_12192 [Desulfoluna spongiiphila]
MKKAVLHLMIVIALVLCTGCTTMISRVVERSALSNMKEKPIHEAFYISPATRCGDTVYRWYHHDELDRDFGSWIEVLEINGEEIHLASYPEGDIFLHRVHYWVKDHKVIRAELHYRDSVFPLSVEPARKDGMYTSFEALDLAAPQELTIGGATFRIHRIETLSVHDVTSAVGTTYGTRFKSIRYISNEVSIGAVKEETFFSTQVLRDNWEYVKLGLKALDPMRSSADTLMGLLRTFREKEKTNFQIEFFQEKREKNAPPVANAG